MKTFSDAQLKFQIRDVHAITPASRQTINKHRQTNTEHL
jgi:hypothetical protein